MHGKGKITHPNGDTFDGEWAEDMANGMGVFIGTNGSTYTGNWLNDL